MGEGVKGLVAGYLEELSGRGTGRSKPVTFSIRLSEREHARLLWLAESLQTPKTPLAERLLRAAVDEAIEEYAKWASPEDPEGFVADALSRVEGREPGSARKPGPRGRKKPHHGPEAGPSSR